MLYATSLLAQYIDLAIVMKEQGVLQIKVVLLGDGNVGKTSLIISYSSNRFPQDYVPTVIDNYLVTLKYGDYLAELNLWDTAGQDEYQRLRSLSYPNTDIFLICFSLVDPKSFNHALNKWLPQVNQNCPNALKIFVGTKVDLFKEQKYQLNLRNRPIILPYQIMNSKIAAHGCKLFTCSALCSDGLNGVFDQAIKQVLLKRSKICPKKKESQTFCNLI